jgi:hypothetical protein
MTNKVGRPTEMPDWMLEAEVRITPLKPTEIMETLAAIKDVQNEVVIHFNVLLCNPSSAAMERLSEARQREQDVFRTVLGQDIPVRERVDRRHCPRRIFNRVESYIDAT